MKWARTFRLSIRWQKSSFSLLRKKKLYDIQQIFIIQSKSKRSLLTRVPIQNRNWGSTFTSVLNKNWDYASYFHPLLKIWPANEIGRWETPICGCRTKTNSISTKVFIAIKSGMFFFKAEENIPFPFITVLWYIVRFRAYFNLFIPDDAFNFFVCKFSFFFT